MPGKVNNDTAVSSKPQSENESLAKVTVKTFKHHASSINSVALTNHEKSFICSSDDGSIQLWDLHGGSLKQSFKGHKSAVSECRATHDGAKMISTSWDKTVVFWDIETSKPLWNHTHVGMATCCSLSHDGRFAISGSDLDNSVTIWNVHDGSVVEQIKCFKNTVNSCCFSSQMYRFCATSFDGSVRVFDIRNYCNEIEPSRLLTLSGHRNIIANAAFSNDDRHLAVASWDKTISVWDVNAGHYRKSGPVRFMKGHEGNVSSCRFSQDGTLLVSSSYDTTLAIWDAHNAFKKFSLQGHTDWVTDCVISKDNNWVLSSSKDGSVRLWNISKRDQIPIVVENRKTIGLNVYRCETCSGEFSTANRSPGSSTSLCVFCRLKQPSSVYSFGV